MVGSRFLSFLFFLRFLLEFTDHMTDNKHIEENEDKE